MRIPIFSHRANPAVDRPICKKKAGYVEALIADRLARWLDANNKSAGVVLKGQFLPMCEESREHKMAAGTMNGAWGIMQSGYAGPFVWQMRREQGIA